MTHAKKDARKKEPVAAGVAVKLENAFRIAERALDSIASGRIGLKSSRAFARAALAATREVTSADLAELARLRLAEKVAEAGEDVAAMGHGMNCDEHGNPGPGPKCDCGASRFMLALDAWRKARSR